MPNASLTVGTQVITPAEITEALNNGLTLKKVNVHDLAAKGGDVARTDGTTIYKGEDGVFWAITPNNPELEQRLTKGLDFTSDLAYFVAEKPRTIEDETEEEIFLRLARVEQDKYKRRLFSRCASFAQARAEG